MLNSIEVAQITVFDWLCGLRCKPSVLEVAYGLERLCYALSARRQSCGLWATAREVEFSKLSFGLQDVALNLGLFKRAERALALNFKLPPAVSFYSVFDELLEMISLYNALAAKRALKRSALRLVLTRVQRCVSLAAVALGGL